MTLSEAIKRLEDTLHDMPLSESRPAPDDDYKRRLRDALSDVEAALDEFEG